MIHIFLGQHLRIVETQQHNQGEYICRAENHFGKVEVSVTLKVLRNPNGQQSFFDDNENEILPRKGRNNVVENISHERAVFDSLLPSTENSLNITHKPTKILRSPKGSSLEIECDAVSKLTSGTPDILYWTKDRQVVRLSTRVHQMGNGSLMVYNMTENDSGMYECVAKRGRERRTTRAQVSFVPAGNELISQPLSTSNLQQNRYAVDANTGNDDPIIVILEKASKKVDEAVDATLIKMMSENASKSDAIRALRYPTNEEDR